MKSPLTVIINFWNAERFIEETLRSIAAQPEEIPIIAVDNQSTDGSRGIVERFANVTYLSTPERFPLGAARNYGLELVDTPYVTWLDSDDLWEPEYSRAYFQAFRARPDALVFSSGSQCIDENSRDLKRWNPWNLRYRTGRRWTPQTRLRRGDSLDGLIVKMRPRQAWCSYAFQTAAIRRLGCLRDELRFAVDLDLIGRLVTQGECVHIDADLTRYRVHHHQSTRTLDPESRYGEALEVVRQLASLAETRPDVPLTTLEKVVAFKSRLARRNLGAALRLAADPRVLSWLLHRSRSSGATP